MIRSTEALRIDIVDFFRPRRTRRQGNARAPAGNAADSELPAPGKIRSRTLSKPKPSEPLPAGL